MVATRKGSCESKTSPVISNNINHQKRQNKHGRFLSMSFQALALFADVKRKVLKTQRHLITESNVIVLLR